MSESLPALDEYLEGLLKGGLRQVAQVAVLPGQMGAAWVLCHQADVDRVREGGGGLEVVRSEEAARRVAQETGKGEHRFLHGAPNLRQGWVCLAETVGALRRFLDTIYPAALGLARARAAGTCVTVTLREKLGRQTGMYRSAGRLSDTRAQSLARSVCHPETGCLRVILWEVREGMPLHSLPPEKFPKACVGNGEVLPFFCAEPCNWFVARAREEARQEVIVVDG